MATAAYLVVYGSWQVTSWGPLPKPLMGDLLCYPVDLAAVWMTWRASCRVRAVPRLRRAWRWLLLGSLAYFLGDVTFTVYDALGIAPYPSIADGFYLLFYPLMLAGLLSFPAARRSRGESLRFWMDSAVVVLAFSAVVFYVTIVPNVEQSGDLVQMVFSMAYPVGDMVLLLGVSAALLHGSGASVRTPLRLLAAGFALYVVADLVYGYESLQGAYQSGDPVDAIWVTTLGLIAVAASAQPALGRPEPIGQGRDRVGKLPLLGVAVGFGVLLYSDHNDTFFPGLTISLVVLALAAVLALRLYLGQQDLLGAKERLTHQAFHDSLTGLANRELLNERLDRALSRSTRSGSAVAVLLLDVDDFKLINDSLGHAAGDELLVALSERFVRVTRAAETLARPGGRGSGPDQDQDLLSQKEAVTLARLGGDEFVLAAEGRFGEREVAALAGRLMAVFSEPFVVGGRTRQVTGSLGVAVAQPGAEATATQLLRDADTAMYRAKTSGKARFDVFDAQMRYELVRRVELGEALDRSLRNGRLDVVFQPIVSVGSGQILAAEALVRWTSDRWGEVSANEFIPLAEENGLILPLGRFVLGEAVREMARWRARAPGALPLGVFVNVAPRELREPDYASHLAATLERHGLRSGDIALELTERVFIDDDDSALNETLAALTRNGTQLVLDDFGTGYSALASLERFPLAAVKIDRSFITRIDRVAAPAPITRAVVSLGHTLGLRVIAEGIESDLQLDYLRRLGCDAGQGFLLGSPQSPEALTRLLVAETAGRRTVRVPRAPRAENLLTSETHYREFVERAIDAIYTADLDGNLASVNPAAERISGFSRDELLAMNIFDLVAPEESERIREILALALAECTDMTTELELVAKNGRRVSVEVTGHVVTVDGKPDYLEGIVRETSERHLPAQQAV